MDYTTRQTLDVIARFLVPVVVIVVGIWAKNLVAGHERRASLHGRIIEKRVEIYDSIGQLLNDIYAYVVQVGQWKEFTPYEIVEKKRHVDKVLYTSRPQWSDTTFAAYDKFMQAAFEVYTGMGVDAKIRASSSEFKSLDNWDSKWEGLFSMHPSSPKEIRASYQILMKQLASEFGYYQRKRDVR